MMDPVEHTKSWIKQIVIGCNFCPFAKREMERESIRYVISATTDVEKVLAELNSEFILLDEDASIETSLIIFPNSFSDFTAYLDIVSFAEELLKIQGYEGVYQIASFHPEYQFAGVDPSDASNYTNRSPYPMLHLLREASLEKALEHYPHPEIIPEQNISKARSLGAEFFAKWF